MNLRIERTYRAPIERVFDAWTSEEVLRRWWRTQRDWETSEAQVEVVPRVRATRTRFLI